MGAARVVLQVRAQPREPGVKLGGQGEAQDITFEDVEAQRRSDRVQWSVLHGIASQGGQCPVDGVELVLGRAGAGVIVGESRAGPGGRGGESLRLLVPDRQSREPGCRRPRRAQPGHATAGERARPLDGQVDLAGRRCGDCAHGRFTVRWSMLCAPLTRTNTRTSTPCTRSAGTGISRWVDVEIGSV